MTCHNLLATFKFLKMNFMLLSLKYILNLAYHSIFWLYPNYLIELREIQSVLGELVNVLDLNWELSCLEIFCDSYRPSTETEHRIAVAFSVILTWSQGKIHPNHMLNLSKGFTVGFGFFFFLQISHWSSCRCTWTCNNDLFEKTASFSVSVFSKAVTFCEDDFWRAGRRWACFPSWTTCCTLLTQ